MKLMKRLAGGAAITLLAMAATSAVYAQETTSAVHGTVIGADGAPVAGASVTILHTPSGTRATAVTNDVGVFDARGLRVGGPYTITASGPGLEPKSVEGVNLIVGDTYQLAIEYGGQVSEVAVTGTRNRDREAGPKTVLGREQIADVATINRDIRDLARRDLLVSQQINNPSASNNGGISIAGSNPRTNRITIDGVAAQDPYGLEGGGMPTSRGSISLDAVEQFSIAAVPTDVGNGNFTGGAMNLVLRSGGNQFHGSLFQNFLSNSTTGHWNRGNNVTSAIHQVNYGGFLSGPIWKDKLFFAASYETFSTNDSAQFGPAGEGYPNPFNNATRAQITSFNTILSGYTSKYNPGDIVATSPITDRKYSGKIDWNITDQHRASLTYRHADSSFVSRADLSATVPSLYSHWYNASYKDDAYTLDVNSNWTDRLSTNLKITDRKWIKGQDPTTGANYSDVSVCLTTNADATPVTDNATLLSCASGFSTLRYGPDLNRHANRLNIAEKQAQLTANYTLNNHVFKAGYQFIDKHVFNVFVPNALGTYTFDSLADFNSGTAQRLQYQYAVSGNLDDAAAILDYNEHSAFLQDTIQINDTLKATIGARVDLFTTDSTPIANPNFKNRYGYSNTNTIDGEVIFMPRVSVEWRPKDTVKINAGGGLFSGGFPEVLFATPYYNTGYATNSIDIRRCPVATIGCVGGYYDASNTDVAATGFNAAVGAAALDGLKTNSTFGYSIPVLVQQYLQGKLAPGGTPVISSLAPTFSLANGFNMPGEWKGYLKGDWDVGGGWSVQAQYIASKTNNGLTFYDARASRLTVNGVQQVLPDGRLRYDGLTTTTANRTLQGITSTNGGTNNDIITANSNAGDAFIASVSVAKSFAFGLDMQAGIAIQNVNELSPGLRFGTTVGSLYNSVPAGLDPNRDAIGRGIEEVGHRYKLDLSYRKKFFGDNETRITLFGERTSGRPYGFTMADFTSGRSPVFGVTRTAQALYIPDIAGDANPNDLNVGLVTFGSSTGQTAIQARDLFLGYIQRFNLPTAPGLLSKYHNTNVEVNRMDLQISQQLPTFIEGHKIKVQVDVRNVLNLLNNKWGRVEDFSDSIRLASVACANSAGVEVGSTSTVCDRYVYKNIPTSITPSFNSAASVWYAQIGLRYEF